MIYIVTLILHITIACTTIAVLVYAAYALLRGKAEWYKHLAIIIASLATIETASGFALAMLSPTVTVASVGVHLLMYLGVCLVAEVPLLVRLRQAHVWIG